MGHLTIESDIAPLTTITQTNSTLAKIYKAVEMGSRALGILGEGSDVPMCVAIATLNQVMADDARITTIFSKASKDTDNMFDPSKPTEIKIKTKGTYIAIGYGLIEGNALNNREINIKLNTAIITDSSTPGSTAGNLMNVCSVPQECNVGDIFNLCFWQKSGSSLLLYNSIRNAKLAVLKVGD
jgi:hypothetical protein